ncbi:polymer-forming cytoskeletal protein [Deinococcus planocerae]|uniref:polymer-forming cytoskeletal protein n=1 Tax=Deinococcus planocerae TaxID=1737569 RepID=UPI0011AEE2E3|nr:polymer-forming cytoskeletal protein [Deinococcus planocerae]
MRDQRERGKLTRRTSALLASLTLGGSALGLEWRTGDVVRVPANEVIRDDLYVLGQDVQIDGTVEGDLIAAGNTVRVNGPVRGNVWAAGQSVTLGGAVTGAARLAGSVLRVGENANIGRDLLAAGVGLDVTRGARVGRDVAFGGTQTRLNGTVARNAYVGAYGVAVGGTVGGDARFNVDNRATWPQNWTPGVARPDPLPSGLRFTGDGRVNGDLTLRMPDRPTLPPNAVGGQVDYAPLTASWVSTTPDPMTVSTANVEMSFLRDFVGIALAGLLLVWLARSPLAAVTARLRALPGASLGYGALTFVGFPLAVLVVAGVIVFAAVLLTMLGLGNLVLPLALIGAPVLLGVGALLAWAAWFAAQGLAASLLGTWLVGAARPGRAVQPSAAVLLGAFVLALLAQVPVLGGLMTLAALLLTLGALWLWWRGPREPRVGTLSTPHPA